MSAPLEQPDDGVPLGGARMKRLEEIEVAKVRKNPANRRD
jgi:hypothetical protein